MHFHYYICLFFSINCLYLNKQKIYKQKPLKLFFLTHIDLDIQRFYKGLVKINKSKI